MTMVAISIIVVINDAHKLDDPQRPEKSQKGVKVEKACPLSNGQPLLASM